MPNTLARVTTAVDGFGSVVATTAGNMAGAIAGPVTVGLTVYILWLGYLVIFGKLDSPLPTVTMKALKISLIVYFALGMAVYMPLVYGAIQGAEALLVSVFSSGAATSIPDALAQSLVDIWTLIELKSTERVPMEGGNPITSALVNMLPDFNFLFFKIAVTLGQIIMVIAGFLPYIIAKITLMLLGALGPLFIVMLIWPGTQRFFDSWVTSVVAALLTFAIIAALVGFVVPLANGVINAPGNAAISVDNLVFLIVPLQLIFAWMLWTSGSIAGQLAGGGGSGNPMTTLASTLIHHGLGRLFRRGNQTPARGGAMQGGRAGGAPSSGGGAAGSPPRS